MPLIIAIVGGLLTLGACTEKDGEDTPRPPLDDTAIDTDGNTPPDRPQVEATAAVDADTLDDCTLAEPPALNVRFLGASPNIESIPIAVIDGVLDDTAPEGFCLEQTFTGGGAVTHCGRTTLDAPNALLQGVPAPTQTVGIRLGTIVGDQLCWSDDTTKVELGDLRNPGFDYTPHGKQLSTPDYPPSTLGMLNIDDQGALFAMSLMDAPNYGILAGDILWYLSTNTYVHGAVGPVIETHRMDNGLMVFSSEDHSNTRSHEVFDPNFRGVNTVAVDIAGFEWMNQMSCADPEAEECFGFIHHGNALLADADINLTLGYERLYNGDTPYLYEDEETESEYYLIGATLQGHEVGINNRILRTFELSLGDLFGWDPDDAPVHGPRTYESPDGSENRTAFYFNALDAVKDPTDSDLYHLTGTNTVRPYNGFFHITMTADGEVMSHRGYNNINPDLTWETENGLAPLDDLGHNAEYVGVDEDGRTHFLVYDRSVKVLSSPYPRCAGFYHVVDDGGVMSLGGPYNGQEVTSRHGDICGNSMSYGNVSALYDLSIDTYDAPMHVAVMFDNAALLSHQGGNWGEITTVYAPGTPRIMTLFLNDDRFSAEGWTQTASFVGHNIDGNNPAGFNSLITDWATVLVADGPFALRGINAAASETSR